MKHMSVTWSNTEQSYGNDYNDYSTMQIIIQTYNH